MLYNLHLLSIPLLLIAFQLSAAIERQPVYKYRYETKDMMKTSATSIPVRGYHVVEGGYYPQESGLGRTDRGFASGSAGGFQHDGISSGGRFSGFGRTDRGFGSGSAGGFQHDGISSGGRFRNGRFSGGGPYGDSNYESLSSGEPFGGSIGGSVGSSIGSHGGGFRDVGYGGGLSASGDRFFGGHQLSHRPHFGSHRYGPVGGDYVDRNYYQDDHRRENDGKYENAHSKSDVEGGQEGEGYQQDKVALKDSKGDTGYYADEKGAKKVLEDGKHYNGAEKSSEQGNNGVEKKQNSGHKKGHVIKGFKTSHHKDESGKTEEYFDEEHDEGGNTNFDGRSGNYAHNKENGFKGSNINDQYGSDEQRKQGHYDHLKDIRNDNADKGQYGQKEYFGKGQVYGLNNGIDAQSLLGHQEHNRFQKEHPYNVPFYSY